MWLTIKDIATHYNIKPSTIYKWVREGKIPHFRICSLIRFKSEEVAEWIEKHKKGAESVPEMSFQAKNCDSLDPRDVARNAIDEVLGLGYNSSQRGNQIDKPGKEGS